jgi:superfamily I DNA/RNA helicase
MTDSLLTQNVNAAADPPALTPSPFQEAIYSAVRETDDPILIEAVAGSGKTTTIVQATEFASDPCLFLAFNKSIAEEIGRKISKGTARTLNSLGHRIWMQNCPNAKLESRKTERLVEQVMTPNDRRQIGFVIQRVISAAKAAGVGLEGQVTGDDFDRFITAGDWDIDDAQVYAAASYAARIFSLSRDDLATFDFDDQLYGPVYHRWTFPTFSTVMIDEAQDLNRIQHLFLEALVNESARLVAVGDRHQAIYGFRGALSNSMDLLKAHFRMLELPLSVSYRCPLSVIAEAQALVPHIQPRPGAPAGAVYWRDRHCQSTGQEPAADPELFREGELVVCRNNAPLFSAVMRHVRARQPCRVLSNTLEGLASFIRRFRAPDTLILLTKLDRWLEKETAAAQQKGMDWKVAALQDKAETVRSLAEGFTTTEEILGVIRQLSEGRSGPVFSTIHKAKGLEAEDVYFLRPDLLPSWWIKEPEALQQEANLRYVAITRAKSTLTYGLKGDQR